MAKKRAVVYRGFLVAEDVSSQDKDDKTFWDYWKRINDTLYVIGDADTKEVTFLNRELKDVAKKFEGLRVKITIEQDLSPPGRKKGKLPDPNEEIEGFEKVKRITMNLFKIS